MLYRLKSVGRTHERLLDLSTHGLNISVNTFVAVEAILCPTTDSLILTQLLHLMRLSLVSAGIVACNVAS